jgi:hypothetical protein
VSLDRQQSRPTYTQFNRPLVMTVHDELSSSSFSVKDFKKPEDTGTRPKMRRRHSVDFTSGHKVLEIDKPDQELKEEIWYSREEYDIIKARNSLIVKMMKTGSFRESDEHTFRGLEHKLKDGFKQRRSNKFAALNAVLEEQDRQMNRSLTKPDVIAEAYRRVSLNARETAFAIGLKDTEQSLVFEERAIGEITGKTISVDPSENDDEDELTDIETVCTEESTAKKNRLRRLFSNVSRKRDTRMSRRSSM